MAPLPHGHGSDGHFPQDVEDLARLIRQSPLLDVAAKRHWLRLIPHLSALHRERLEQILREQRPEPAGRSSSTER